MTGALAKAEGILRDRIEELERERVELEGALSAMAERRSPQVKSPRQTMARQSRGKSTSRMPRADREGQLLEAAKASPEATNAVLARQLGVTPAYVSMLLKEMGTTGKLKRKDGKLVAKR